MKQFTKFSQEFQNLSLRQVFQLSQMKKDKPGLHKYAIQAINMYTGHK